MGYQRIYRRTGLIGGNLGAGEVVTLLDTRRPQGGDIFRGLSMKVLLLNIFVDTISAVNGFVVSEIVEGGLPRELFATTIDPADGYRKIYIKVGASDLLVQYTHGAAPATVTEIELLKDLNERGGTP